MKNKKNKIYLAGFNSDQLNTLKSKFKNIDFLNDKNTDFKLITKCDAIVAISRQSLDQLYNNNIFINSGKIKWIHAPGAGIEQYINNNASNYRFVLTNGKIIQGIEVADHAMALLLALTRRLNLIFKYGQQIKFKNKPIELRGKNALIVGYGGIGRCLAERAFAFGMKVNIINNIYSPYSNFINKFYLIEDFEKVIKDADVVFITAPLTKSTKKLVNRKNINKFKNNSILINVSRGGIVCIDTLVKHLKKGKFSGIGLDVTDPEPLPKNHYLFTSDKVIITPHIAGMSDNLSNRSFELIINNIRRFDKGMELLNKVDVKEGY